MRTTSPVRPSYDPKQVLIPQPLTPIEIHIKLTGQFQLECIGSTISVDPQMVGAPCPSCPRKFTEGELVKIVEIKGLRRLQHYQCPA